MAFCMSVVAHRRWGLTAASLLDPQRRTRNKSTACSHCVWRRTVTRSRDAIPNTRSTCARADRNAPQGDSRLHRFLLFRRLVTRAMSATSAPEAAFIRAIDRGILFLVLSYFGCCVHRFSQLVPHKTRHTRAGQNKTRPRVFGRYSTTRFTVRFGLVLERTLAQ